MHKAAVLTAVALFLATSLSAGCSRDDSLGGTGATVQPEPSGTVTATGTSPVSVQLPPLTPSPAASQDDGTADVPKDPSYVTPEQSDKVEPAVADEARAYKVAEAFIVALVTMTEESMEGRETAIGSVASPAVTAAAIRGDYGTSAAEARHLLAEGWYQSGVRVTSIKTTGNAGQEATFHVSYSYTTKEMEGEDAGKEASPAVSLTIGIGRDYRVRTVY